MIEEALIQGAVSGGTSTFCIFMTFKYIMPKLDKISNLLSEVNVRTSKCDKRGKK